MSHFDRSVTALEDQEPRRPANSRPRLGDRLARTFGSFDRTRAEMPEWESSDDLGYAEEDDSTTAWDSVQSRFPLARSGYEQSVVDEHIASLERELDELRSRQSGAVSAEIEKIGEQTSAILLLAHDKSREITRNAQEQADRCVADAASNAVALTENAKQRLRQLDAETDAIWQERNRLLEDARRVASSMTALIETATARFPAETERATVAIAPVSEPVITPSGSTGEPAPAADVTGSAQPQNGATAAPSAEDGPLDPRFFWMNG